MVCDRVLPDAQCHAIIASWTLKTTTSKLLSVEITNRHAKGSIFTVTINSQQGIRKCVTML
jgi:hypothetical protein